jgi:hypothetical protein
MGDIRRNVHELVQMVEQQSLPGRDCDVSRRAGADRCRSPAAPLASHPASHARTAAGGPGYPPPGGIYAPFTNCPVLNPLVQEAVSNSALVCSAGNVTSGSITIGNITTPVVRLKFKLINPLLGNNCHIGNDNQPIVVNPNINLPPGGRWSS